MSVPDDDAPRPAAILVFTGHRVDAPERARPRFPAAAEERARELLTAGLAGELTAAGGPVIGLAGGASGGDILFHEIAGELGMPTELCLALPPEEYRAASVADAGQGWVERFEALRRRLPTRVLPEPAAGDEPALSIWERCNLWMLDDAFARAGGGGVILLALWNRAAGDDAGGTADMVAEARRRGARTVVLDAGWLLAEDG